MVSPRTLGVLAAFAGLTIAFAAGPVDAATKKKRPYVLQPYTYIQAEPGRGQTVFTSRGEDGRTRTKIILQKRSYLDAGTEVKAGDRKFTDYVYPPGYNPSAALGSRYNVDRQPLNGVFDFGSSRF